MGKVEFARELDELLRSGPWPTTKKGALDDSIRKWEFLVEHPDTSNDSETCALCHLYYGDDDDDRDDEWQNCDGCPVFEKTGQRDCRGTPWKFLPDQEEAEAMLTFLKSLRIHLYGRTA